MLERIIVWRSLESTGLERCEIRSTRTGWSFQGVVIRVQSGTPAQVSYQIFCDKDWSTRRVRVLQLVGKKRSALAIQVDKNHRWWSGARELREVRGCIDVDLRVSALTNTLPIRRLGLQVSEGQDVAAAWIGFPVLKVRRLEQRYTNLGRGIYRYQSRGGFSARIRVDKLGFVIHYPGLATREAEA